VSAYFVTATGTDIGKTFVVAGLIRSLRAVGKTASVLKPVVSGFTMANSLQSDPGVLLKALGEAVTPQSIARLSPWRFMAPLSPNMAATLEARHIDFDSLIRFCRDAIPADTGLLLIEGVGGIMVPLDDSRTVLDWACALDLPLILVAGSYLGAISHTLTALKVISSANLIVAALVVNDSGQGAVPIEETIKTLRGFTSVPIVAMPRSERADAMREAFQELLRLVEAH
jgi:dethiobiotin synthetase